MAHGTAVGGTRRLEEQTGLQSAESEPSAAPPQPPLPPPAPWWLPSAVFAYDACGGVADTDYGQCAEVAERHAVRCCNVDGSCGASICAQPDGWTTECQKRGKLHKMDKTHSR